MSRRATKRTLGRYRSGANLSPGDHERMKRWKRRMNRYARMPDAPLSAQFVVTFTAMKRTMSKFANAMKDAVEATTRAFGR